MKYRKKPVVIEAWQWDGQGIDEWPQWVIDWERDGRCVLIDVGGKLEIPTLEGDHQATRKDWIIRGIQGELYPCKPDIFEATYEAVE